MASGLYNTSTPEGKAAEDKYGTPGTGGTSLSDVGSSLWKGYSGANQKGITNPKLGFVDQRGQDRGLALESRGLQDEYGNLLRAQMSGGSIAAAQYQANRQAAMRGAMATAASARGANVGLAGRSAAQAAGQNMRQSGLESSIAQTGERLGLLQQFGAMAQAKRLQDLQAQGLTIEEAKAQLAADTAKMEALAKIGEGEAERRQKAYGGVALGIGGIVGSDPYAKTGAQPIGTGAVGYQGAGFGTYNQNGQNPYYTAPTAPAPAPMMSAPLPAGNVQPRSYSMANSYPGLAAAGGMDPGTSTVAPPMQRDSSGALTMGNPNPQVKPAGQPNPPDARDQSPMAGLMTGLGSVGGGAGGSSAPTDPLAELIKRLDERKAKQETASGKGGNAIGDMFTGLGSVGSGWEMKTGQQPVGGAYPNLTGSPQPPSDPEEKSQRHPGQDLVAEAAQVQPFSFHYRPEAAAAQGVSTEERTGVMANRVPGSLEENPIYAPTVEKDEHGMASVNAGQATMANIAVTSDMAKRQLALESQFADLKRALGKKKSGRVTSDPSSKAQIKALMDENANLKQALTPSGGAVPPGHFRAPGEQPTAGEQQRAANRSQHMIPYASNEQRATADAADYATKKAQHDYEWEKFNTSVARPAPAGSMTNAAYDSNFESGPAPQERPPMVQQDTVEPPLGAAMAEARRKNAAAVSAGAPWNTGWQGAEAPAFQSGGTASPVGKPQSFTNPRNGQAAPPHDTAPYGEKTVALKKDDLAESKVGDYVGKLLQINPQDAQTRRKHIQAVSRVLSGGSGKPNQGNVSALQSPRHVYSELKARGVPKITMKEVKAAMTETEL